MFRRSTPTAAVRRHRRARPSPWQWLAAPARRAAVVAVSGALALVGLVVAVAAVGTPDHGSPQAGSRSTRSAARWSGDPARTPSGPGSSATGSVTATTESATTSAAGTSAARSTPSGGLSLTQLIHLTGSPVPTVTGSPSTATTPQPTESPVPQPPLTQTPTLSSPLPSLTPGKPPGSSLHPTPGHGTTHKAGKP